MCAKAELAINRRALQGNPMSSRINLALCALSLAPVLTCTLIPTSAHARQGEEANPAAAQTGNDRPITSAIDPRSRALAAQIVDLGYPEETREALFFGTMDQTVSQMRSAIAPSLPNDDPGALAILDAWILEYTERSKQVLRKHIPAIMDGLTEAYAELFTQGELEDILAFVETPSGQRYFELSPAILGAEGFAMANQRYLDESVALLGPAQADLRARLQEYLDKASEAEAAPDT